MPGIGVLSNRNARLNRLNPKLKNRMAFMLGQGGEVISTGSLDDAQKAVEEFRRVDVDMVAISGGDGTAHRTIEMLIRVYAGAELPPVLLLPTGSHNIIPHSFGIHDSGVATLLLAMARYRHNVPLRCVKRNVLCVNGHYSFMFACGSAPRFLKALYDSGDKSPVAAARLVGKLCLEAIRGGELAKALAAPMQVRAHFDNGPEREIVAHSLFCSFVEELALRFHSFPRAGWDEGVFEVASIEGPPWTFAKALPALWKGSLRELDGVRRTLARSVELQLDAPEAYTLDGELYDPCDRFRISTGPEMVFVVPGLKLRRPDPRIRMTRVGPWDMRFIV